MKRTILSAVAVLLTLGFALPGFAASPWSGTWKLDHARSHMAGGTITLTQTGPHSYHFSRGNISENIICDGKVHPTIAGFDGTCKALSGGAYAISTLRNGKVLSRSRITFSRNGKKQYVATTSYHADGKTSTSHGVYTRLSGTTGMAGRWRETHYSTSAPGTMVYSVSGDTLHIYDPVGKEHVDAKLDGTPAPVVGQNAPKGFTVSLHKVNSRELREVDRLNGKTISEGTDTLSADGKTMTDVSWTPGQSSSKEIEVYRKQ